MVSPLTSAQESAKGRRIGSGPGGQPISLLLCANSIPSDSTASGVQCSKPGTMTCSNCHLVSYCSKECQTIHWKRHRTACKSPYLNNQWQPAWVMQNREPAFMVGSNQPIYSSFGLPSGYLWGNTPAIDCLNVIQNEGQSCTHQNFKFCFAASGDIRNLVSTVNGLPHEYRGNCQILLNDLNPLVVGHNLVVLCALLDPEYPIEDAAELALNLMYSVALTPSMASALSRIEQRLSNTHPSQTINIPTTGGGSIQTKIQLRDLKITLDMLRSSYGLQVARQGYSNIMLSPERVDFRDRYLSSLKPGHRLGSSKFRESGVLAPFSLDLSNFTEPNRLLFSPKGHWLLRDSENPLSGWNVATVKKSGKAHGTDMADVYGGLFFHIKDEFIKFATRFREFDIGITLTLSDARDISRMINEGLVPPFNKFCFDRIETSNLADYLTIPRILNDWSSLLNRQNKYASLLMSLMNWRQDEVLERELVRGTDKTMLRKYAAIMGVDIMQVSRRNSPSMFQFIEGLTIFKDENKEFQAYLDKVEAHRVATSHGMRMRTRHRIHPKLFGLSISKPSKTILDINAEEYYDIFTLGGSLSTTRFMEFEASG